MDIRMLANLKIINAYIQIWLQEYFQIQIQIWIFSFKEISIKIYFLVKLTLAYYESLKNLWGGFVSFIWKLLARYLGRGRRKSREIGHLKKNVGSSKFAHKWMQFHLIQICHVTMLKI